MGWPLFQVDALCAEPFAGNPAAVCLLEDRTAAEPSWMQLRAALVHPTVEVELCGRAGVVEALGAGTS